MLPFLLETSRFDDPATVKWVVICLVLLAAVYLILRPKGKKKKDPLERQNSPPGLTLAQQRGLERDMSTLVTELLEMSRQMTAQMETRAAKLELLLKEADEKIAQLREATRHAQNGDGETSPTSLPAPAASAGMAPAPIEPRPSDPRYEQVYSLAAEGRSIPQIVKEVGIPSGEIELILALRSGKG